MTESITRIADALRAADCVLIVPARHVLRIAIPWFLHPIDFLVPCVCLCYTISCITTFIKTIIINYK